MKAIYRAFTHVLFSYRVEGLQHWPEGPAVITPNHVSYLDGPLLAAIAPTRPLFTVTKPFTKGPWKFGLQALKAVGCGDYVALDPEQPLSMRRLVSHVKTGGQVVIFPEGGIGVGDRPWKAGAHWLARKTQAPIVKVQIDGAQHSLFGRARWKPNTPITVSIKEVTDVDFNAPCWRDFDDRRRHNGDGAWCEGQPGASRHESASGCFDTARGSVSPY